MTAKDDSGATSESRTRDLRFTKPSRKAAKSKGSGKHKAASGTARKRMGTLELVARGIYYGSKLGMSDVVPFAHLPKLKQKSWLDGAEKLIRAIRAQERP